MPRGEITHRDGVYAMRALFEAGDRPELTVSEPSPKAAKLAAVEVPAPFDEPDENAAVDQQYRISVVLIMQSQICELYL